MIDRIFNVLGRETNRLLFKKNISVITAGLGRSGTTVVNRSMVNNHHFKPTPFTSNLSLMNENVTTGYAFKTHDFPPSVLDDSKKLIFLFGNPFNTVISSHRRINEWGKLHHEHLHSECFKSNDDIFFRDSLLLNQHFDKWYQRQNFSFITIKYEMLYDNRTLEELSNFLGFKVKLIPQRQRKTNWEFHPMKETIFNTYRDLYHRIENAESVKIWESN